MKMELLRLSGQPVLKEFWRSAPDIPAADLDECVKDELMSFYEGDEQEFWPKEQYGAAAPEVARIVDNDDQVLAEYDIDDLAEDTGRRYTPTRIDREVSP